MIVNPMHASNGNTSSELASLLQETHLQIWFHSQVLQEKLAELSKFSGVVQDTAHACVLPLQRSIPALSTRLIQVVRLVSLGCSNSQIGMLLNLSESTIDNYRTKAMKLMDAHCSASLTRLAIKYGYTSLYDELTEEEVESLGRLPKSPGVKYQS
jgi:DNA-binding NarL/FixJ family response regulator